MSVAHRVWNERTTCGPGPTGGTVTNAKRTGPAFAAPVSDMIDFPAPDTVAPALDHHPQWMLQIALDCLQETSHFRAVGDPVVRREGHPHALTNHHHSVRDNGYLIG